MSKTYRLALPLLALWLIGWIIWSWAAVQDDAFIHLRYAENLLRVHHIAYDGVHATYGASSLLYVYLLAFLSAFAASSNLPRAVSSGAHLLLYLGMAWLLLRFVPTRSSLARLLGLVLLWLLVSPSTVRWLDDGMETGLGLCLVAAICFAVFAQSTQSSVSPASYLVMTLLAFFLVLLRIEFSVLCGLCFVILLAGDIQHQPGKAPASMLRSGLRSSSFLLGGGLALICILIAMHTLLPDTALAKSDRNWHEVLSATAIVLASAMSFGAGILFFWLLTLYFTCRSSVRMIQIILANSLFPVVLLLAAMHGQEIQGARYLVWTFFFSALWNILELGQSEPKRPLGRHAFMLAGAWMVLFLAVLPFESQAMSRVLRARAHTLQLVQADRLQSLAGQQGIAFDVGYIGYFSHANLCDLAGLINGRDVARLTREQRAVMCAATHPDFIFLTTEKLRFLAPHLSLGAWDVCTQYDFINLRSPDTHYLLLPTATARQTCGKISASAKPYPASSLLQ